MATTKDGSGIKEVIFGEVVQALTMEDVPEGVGVVAEIPKSSHMPRPNKDKQAMAPICMSLRNPLHSKLLMVEKGKVVTIKIDEKEEDLQALIIVEEEDEGMEDDIQPTHSTTKLPTYVPPWKGKTKVPKELDKTKSSHETLLLPDDIMFEGTHLGHVPNMKFEDWDLADHEKFPHLEAKNLMKKNTMGVVTTLEPWKWLCGVEMVGLLNLLWVPHFHHVPINIFIIKQLLCLVHDGYLWL